jgi:hypothetical protein
MYSYSRNSALSNVRIVVDSWLGISYTIFNILCLQLCIRETYRNWQVLAASVCFHVSRVLTQNQITLPSPSSHSLGSKWHLIAMLSYFSLYYVHCFQCSPLFTTITNLKTLQLSGQLSLGDR